MTQKSSHRGAGSNRLAKVIARAGVASRRDAEAMIQGGRVTVNGKQVSVATNVTSTDKIMVDGKPLPAREPARIWLYHKPSGLVTTERDEKGRPTVFDAVREELGRVLSIGRLDLTSEGLLLLTNDGELKRRLELPETGWLRRYRVRVNGHPDEAALERLRAGIEVDGERFAPMQVALDRTQGANAWLTVGLREGRNREIRRAMEAVGVVVTRLIRVSYGPFQLGKLAPGAVEELKPRVLRDQLGQLFVGELAEGRRESTSRKDQPKTKTGQRAAPKSQRMTAEPRHHSGDARRSATAKGRDEEPKGGKRHGAKTPPRSAGKGTGGAKFKASTTSRTQTKSAPDRRADPSASLRGKPKGTPRRGGPGGRTKG